MEYYKLGPNAVGFYDMITGITVSKGQTVAVRPNQKSSVIKAALRNGHLVAVPKVVTQVEVKEEPIPEPEKEPVDWKGMTKSEILKFIEYFDDEDLKKAKSIRKKSDLIEFVKETDKLYE
jgi:hypothetical protein